MWPCEKISELTEFSSGRHDECLDNLKWNSCKWQSMHHRNVAGSSYITQVLVCIPQRIGNSWSLAKKTLWISVLSLTFYNPQALRWLAPNTRVIRSLTRPPITRRVRVEYPTRSTPSEKPTSTCQIGLIQVLKCMFWWVEYDSGTFGVIGWELEKKVFGVKIFTKL